MTLQLHRLPEIIWFCLGCQPLSVQPLVCWSFSNLGTCGDVVDIVPKDCSTLVSLLNVHLSLLRLHHKVSRCLTKCTVAVFATLVTTKTSKYTLFRSYELIRDRCQSVCIVKYKLRQLTLTARPGALTFKRIESIAICLSIK